MSGLADADAKFGIKIALAWVQYPCSAVRYDFLSELTLFALTLEQGPGVLDLARLVRGFPAG
jgi:hypothetical protein